MGLRQCSAWLLWCALPALPVLSQRPAQDHARQLYVVAGKSLVIDSPAPIERISVASGELAEALAVTPNEVLVHGNKPGQTSLILWQQGGSRLLFDLTVRPSPLKLEAIRRELAKELADQEVTVALEDDTVFLRGMVKDMVAAERAVAIAANLGKVVNLLQVAVPDVEPQILLKVRFANVDRAATSELGVNLFSTGALNTTGALTTGQFTPPQPPSVGGQQSSFTFTDALNIFLFRPDLDLGATIRALQTRRMLEVLAEPNVLAIHGKPASFLAGGEFPFPMLQGGAQVGAVTIQFREFGVRLDFLPFVTPRGSIRLQVTPEVSSLDFANGLIFQGFNVPALSSRRVQTEIELEAGQSFGIAGLLDNRVTEALSKVPGLGDIPVLGALFRSRAITKNNTELFILVTPEIVRPIPAGQPPPSIPMPRPFLEDAPNTPMQTPGQQITGSVPPAPVQRHLPIEQLLRLQEQLRQSPASGPSSAPAPAPASGSPVQLLPVPVTPPPAR